MFSTIDLTAPGNNSVDHTVRNGTLTADISWLNSVQDIFAGLGTSVQVWEDDTIIDIIEVDHNKNSVVLGLSPPLTWQSMFTLETTAINTKGDRTNLRQIFGDFPLSPPSNISIKHNYKDDDITAIVTWQNSIEEKFDCVQTCKNILAA